MRGFPGRLLPKRDPIRSLTYPTIVYHGACGRGRDVFQKRWGTAAQVNQKWAQEAAYYLSHHDARWAAEHLLPGGWLDLFLKAFRPYDIWNNDVMWEVHRTRRRRVAWAIFAALYVEAGKP